MSGMGGKCSDRKLISNSYSERLHGIQYFTLEEINLSRYSLIDSLHEAVIISFRQLK